MSFLERFFKAKFAKTYLVKFYINYYYFKNHFEILKITKIIFIPFATSSFHSTISLK